MGGDWGGGGVGYKNVSKTLGLRRKKGKIYIYIYIFGQNTSLRPIFGKNPVENYLS